MWLVLSRGSECLSDHPRWMFKKNSMEFFVGLQFYLYYCYSGCTLKSHDHLLFPECSMVTWPCHVTLAYSVPILPFTPLYTWVFEMRGEPFSYSRFSQHGISSAYTFHTPYMILSPPLYTIPALTGMPHLKCPLYSAPVPFVIGCVLDFSSTLFATPFVAWPHTLPLLPLVTSFLLSKEDTFCTCVPFLHT